ncbi:MAG: sodium:proton antiporter [Planctomycetes bacterium]|nr:sodium:proton antiporter [Planctomycetota bacterium]
MTTKIRGLFLIVAIIGTFAFITAHRAEAGGIEIDDSAAVLLAEAGHEGGEGNRAPASDDEHSIGAAAEEHGEEHGGHHGVDGTHLGLLWIVPFIGILLSIAIFPLVKPHFWHHHYGKVALFWMLAFALPFLYNYGGNAVYEIMHIVLLDYVPFIILLTALFTSAGGICLKGSLRGSPKVNTIILALGTVLASWMGTTGAAMLLIRPLIRANAWRKHKVHIIVFFIFLVANIGGSLTPLGDPPLFLGFLKGVSFFWTLKLLYVMAPLAILLLIIYYVFDSVLYKKEELPPDDGAGNVPLKLDGKANFILIIGIVAAILLSSSLANGPFKDQEVAKKHEAHLNTLVATMDVAKERLDAHVKEHESDAKMVESKEYNEVRDTHFKAVAEVNSLRAQISHDESLGVHLPGLGITIPFANLVRDGLLILIAIISLIITPMYKMVPDEHGHLHPEPGSAETNVRAANGFTWEPILEVAKLFIAIFVCMIPALKILQAGSAGALSSVILAVQTNTNEPINAMYFWFTGLLSSFLDNAPTYVVFFNTAGGDPTSLMGPLGQTLLAISCGAVFMGANTYIGNAPNFMVKAIAEENNIKMPSFFGYMAWSVAILVPCFVLVSIAFFVMNLVNVSVK